MRFGGVDELLGCGSGPATAKYLRGSSSKSSSPSRFCLRFSISSSVEARHVEQEGDGDVALDLVAAPVDLRDVAVAGALLIDEVDGRVEVDVLAVFELLDLAEHLRLAAARTGAASR